MKRRQQHRGFTIILAVVLLGLIAVAVAMIVHQLGYELRRTRTAYEDAQLRQLLLAGAQDVASNSDRYNGQGQMTPQKVKLPKSLEDAGASLSVTRQEAPGKTGDIGITARVGSREASESLRWEESSHRWSVVLPEQ